MTSYELSNIILELRNQFEDGIIDEQTFNDTVEGLCVEDKLDGLIYANKKVDAEIDMLKKEKERLDAEIKKQERNKANIQTFIKVLMHSTGHDKYSSPSGKISFRKSTSVELDDDFIEANIGTSFVIEDIKYKADKKAIKELLVANEEVPGATLLEKRNLQIK